MVEMHVDAVLFRSRLQHAKAFGDDFLADAVAGNDRDAIFFSLAHRENPYICGISALIRIIGLQWTKVNRGATLQCNVDLFEGETLTVATHRQRNQESIPWTFICAASAS
jgi:hypothetical protein